MYRLGIDVGGTKANIGLLNEHNSIVFKHTEKIPQNKDYKNVLSVLKNTLDAILSKNGISYSELMSCGMGVPGTVSKDGRIAIKIPNLSWENVNLADEFEKLTGIPTKLLQDSRAAAFGEYIAGNGRGKQIVVCVTLGTGIGTGIVINGNIFNGALGGAGELGHIPVVPNGRECGCGKGGCLENYVAGKGLGITAKEVFGKEFTANDIFNYAKSGDEKAKKILDDAIYMLGTAMVAMINLISPDCVLFSGGMSQQIDLFITPLIKYINEHIYRSSSEQNLYIGFAGLGEDAPMVGAALFAQNKNMRKPKLSASIMCADMLHLENDFKDLEESGIDYLHCDIMDGHFVPNLMLPLEMLNKIRNGSRLPYDIHLMTEKPESIIPFLNLKKGDIVSVHLESTPHVQRALTLINDAGATAALAINPSTPIEEVRELLYDIQIVLIMTVNPGFAGQKVVFQSFDKIKRMRKYLDDLGYDGIMIEVDGNCSFDNVPKMYEAGAEMFVVGSSSVFNSKYSIAEGTERLLSILKNCKGGNEK